MSTPQHVIDVRPILADGGCPFDTVIAKAKQFQPSEKLQIIAPFNPLPLYEALKGIGVDFVEVNEEDGCFQVSFQKTPLNQRELTKKLSFLDLEPPQPMTKSAEALAQANAGETLSIHTRFKPMHLLNSLSPEDVEHESIEQDDGTWITILLKKEVKKCDH